MNKKDQHQEEREKKFLLWSAIAFFMVLIISLWSFNIGSILDTAKPENRGIAQEMKEDKELQTLVNDLSQEFDKLKNVTTSQQNASATTTDQQESGASEQKELLQKLKKDLKKGQQ